MVKESRSLNAAVDVIHEARPNQNVVEPIQDVPGCGRLSIQVNWLENDWSGMSSAIVATSFEYQITLKDILAHGIESGWQGKKEEQNEIVPV